MGQYSIKVEEARPDIRLDVFLVEFSSGNSLGLSRTSVQKLISGGKVSVNGSICLKANSKVRKGDDIGFATEDKPREGPKAEDIPLNVVYEDQDLAVINKQPGLVVHPAPGNYEHTLVNALMHRFSGLSSVNPARPGIVHRLDKDTSGLLLIAKNNPAHLELAKQFAAHSIKRKYVALVKGKMEFDENIIEAPIGRHPYKRKSMSVGFGKETKYAKTYYRTVKRSENWSLVELEPFTGRTHQLRVHLAFIGHPVLGDTKYGKNNEFIRLALHAKSIGFTHPRTGKFMEFSSQIPPDFQKMRPK